MSSPSVSDHAVATPLSGDSATLVRRYVGAFYALAEEQNLVDAIATDMRALRRLWSESPEWRFVATDPRLSKAMTVEAVEQTVKIAEVEDLTARFLAILAQNRRLSLLPGMVEGFLQQVAARRGERRADVSVAHALTDAQRDALTTSLAAILGGKVHLTVTEDASILGGLTVRVGSQFIDASLKTKLDRLERTLKAGAA